MTVLEGVRVIDFSEYIAGPFSGMLLGDLGADVIKVEPPEGDRWRQGQFYAPHESRNNLSLNRSKRSIALDLKTDEGKNVIYTMAKTADVVIHNFRPGVMERLGGDYETLARINPRLIYSHNTSFGPQGPLAAKGGYDLLSQAATGLLTRPGSRLQGGRLPVGFGIAIADMSSGMFQALAVCAALWQRERTGRGQKIDTSLLGAGLAIQTSRFMSVESVDREPRESFLEDLRALYSAQANFEAILSLQRDQRPGLGTIYYGVYETKDAPIAVACLNDRLRRRAGNVVGVLDPRFEDSIDDQADPQEITRAARLRVETIMRTKSREEWFALFDAADVPCGPLNFLEEMFEDPQVLANDLVVEVEHATVGSMKMAGPPYAFHGTPLKLRRASPALSQHADEILGELGYTEKDIRDLHERKIVV